MRLSKLDDPILERLQALENAILDNQRLSANGPVFDTSKFSGEDVEVLSGDGKGEFLPDMTESEALEYERNERLGWKGLKLPWRNKND